MKPIKYIAGNRVKDTSYTNGKKADECRGSDFNWIKKSVWYLHAPQETKAL